MQWDYPQSDGGAPVDSYTVSLIGPEAVRLSTTTSVQAMATFTLDYNEEYTVNIAATNCAGTGRAVSLNISEGTARVHTSHVFMAAGQLPVVIYSCSYYGNSLPSVCILIYPLYCELNLADESYSFILAGCGDPTPPANGSVIRFASAAVGSQLLYSCDPGFLPLELMNSTCAPDTGWSPNPAEFTCREPGKYISYG